MPRGIPNRHLDLSAEEQAGETLAEIDVEDELFAPEAPAQEEPLTADQLRIRDLENMLALERGAKDPKPEFEPIAANEGDRIVIHIVGDGLTALGQQWYIGQELEFDPNGRAYKDTFDRRGQSWLSLAGDEMAQAEKYGKVLFRLGRWPGKSYTDAAGAPLQYPMRSMDDRGTVMPPTQDELHTAARQETARGRRAPHLPVR